MSGSETTSLQAQWLSGYEFWRAQYTARNKKKIGLEKSIHKLRDRLIPSAIQDLGFEDEYDFVFFWGTWVYDADIILFSHLRDEPFIKWAHNFYRSEWSRHSKSKNFKLPIEIKHELLNVEYTEHIAERLYFKVKKARRLAQILDIKYPYCARIEHPLDIYDAILDKKFPPILDKENLFRLNDFSRVPIIKTAGYDGVDFSKEVTRMHVEIDPRATEAEIIAQIRSILPKNSNGPTDRPRGRGARVCSAAKKEDEYLAQIQADIMAKGASYRTDGDRSRAIGLLMYDYQEAYPQLNDSSVYRKVEAALFKEYKQKNVKDVSERSYLGWLSQTKKCIQHAEVFSINPSEGK
ncbi:MAG: hypothetical protein Q7J24_06305 [Desulfomicrobium sp.]|nr:hypothetical protein [Desulfomicrobium sp.]